jgi:hypothetical protein
MDERIAKLEHAVTLLDRAIEQSSALEGVRDELAALQREKATLQAEKLIAKGSFSVGVCIERGPTDREIAMLQFIAEAGEGGARRDVFYDRFLSGLPLGEIDESWDFLRKIGAADLVGYAESIKILPLGLALLKFVENKMGDAISSAKNSYLTLDQCTELAAGIVINDPNGDHQ